MGHNAPLASLRMDTKLGGMVDVLEGRTANQKDGEPG